jgi:hypothetical protein
MRGLAAFFIAALAVASAFFYQEARSGFVAVVGLAVGT